MLKLYKNRKRFAFLLFGSLFTFSAFSNTYTVTNTSSNVATVGSLAWAIKSANDNVGVADVIEFALDPSQPCIITLTTALPTITEAVFINGYSQAGSAQGPIASRVIRININAAGTGGNAFTVTGDDVTIAGLAIYSAPGYGIQGTAIPASVSNLHIWGNYIGTDSTGLAAGLGNVGGGIEVNLGSSFTPSNNIVVGIKDDGVNDANEGNLITSSSSGSPNNGDGVLFWRCTNSVIAGNVIGLNKNGTGTGMGNSRDGIVVTVGCSNVVIGTDGDGNASDGIERNVIARNGRNGILLAAISTNNVIAGNTVGLDLTDAAAGNGYGIILLNASNNRIGTDGNGTSDALEKNIIGSSTFAGLRISSESFFGASFESGSNTNVIKGNIIGSNSGLTLSRPNGGNGVELQASLSPFTVNDNVFGTVVNSNDERNIIVNNTGNGIRVLAPAGGTAVTGNKFAGNLIYNNGALGIDLQGGAIETSGVTVNDDGDGDAGANDLLNAPVITSARIDGSDLVLDGFSRPNSVIEFYIADAGPHPNPLIGTKSFGQGQSFVVRAQEGGTLGTITDIEATTGTYDATIEGAGSGGTRTENKFSFRIPLSSLPPVTAGTRFTALAYMNATGAGSTSEFGGVLAISNLPVHFASFTGRIKDGKSFLNWATTEEQNNSYFEVQKSTTGSDFTAIGKVSPKGGVYNQYDFTDANPAAGINYYRLKQVDLDGRSMYSKILTLRSNLDKVEVKAGPNPFAGNINIYYQLEKGELIQIRLYDQGGRTVKQYTTRGGAGVNTFNITDVNSLPKGNYTLELTGETVKHRQQIVKQ